LHSAVENEEVGRWGISDTAGKKGKSMLFVLEVNEVEDYVTHKPQQFSAFALAYKELVDASLRVKRRTEIRI